MQPACPFIAGLGVSRGQEDCFLPCLRIRVAVTVLPSRVPVIRTFCPTAKDCAVAGCLLLPYAVDGVVVTVRFWPSLVRTVQLEPLIAVICPAMRPLAAEVAPWPALAAGAEVPAWALVEPVEPAEQPARRVSAIAATTIPTARTPAAGLGLRGVIEGSSQWVVPAGTKGPRHRRRVRRPPASARPEGTIVPNQPGASRFRPVPGRSRRST